MDDLILLFKKYSLPVILLAIGIVLISFGFDQDDNFKLACVFILISAVLSILNITGRITRGVYWAFGSLSLGLAVWAGVQSYKLIQDEQINEKNYEMVRLKSIRNLKDVITIQNSYFKENNKYCESWDELEKYASSAFIEVEDNYGTKPKRKITLKEQEYLISINFFRVKDGKDTVYYKKGDAIDEEMTVEEAIALKGMDSLSEDLQDKNFKRAKKRVNLIESSFKNRAYLKSREKNNLGSFDLYKLRYIPTTSKEWKIKSITKNNKYYFSIEGFSPYSETISNSKRNIKKLIIVSNYKPNKDNPKLMDFGKLEGSWESE